jgi:hypothetical protein
MAEPVEAVDEQAPVIGASELEIPASPEGVCGRRLRH